MESQPARTDPAERRVGPGQLERPAAGGATPLDELGLDEAISRSLLEQVPDGLLIADEDGHIRLVNRSLEEMFGYDRTDLLGQPLELLVPDDLRSRHRAHRLRYRAAPHRRPMGLGLELEGRRSDATTFPIEISLSPMAGADGTLVIATIRDVSQRREAERRVRWVQRLLDSTSDAVFVFATDSLALLHVNAAASRHTGYPDEQLLTMSPLHFLPGLPERRLRSLLEPLATGTVATVSFETEVLRADGAEVPVEAVVELVRPDPEQQPVFVATARDISERQATQQVLALTRQRLAVAEDRERIARDLHDKVIQRLFATGLGLQAAAGQVETDPVRERLTAAVDDLDQAIRDIRTSIFALHAAPRAAADGLRNGVLETVAESGRTLGFTPAVRFTGPIESVTTPEITDALLATLREILSNVARHAGASHVDVDLQANDALRLVVRDDGVGIQSGADGAGGNGLHNMRQRAVALGGNFSIARAQPSGTEVVWWVPKRVQDR